MKTVTLTTEEMEEAIDSVDWTLETLFDAIENEAEQKEATARQVVLQALLDKLRGAA